MSADKNMYDTVLAYFEQEFAAVRERLKEGRYAGLKERVLVSLKISDALTLLAPYTRGDQRARKLIKAGEALRTELLSVRDVIEKKRAPRKKRQDMLICQVLRKRKPLLLV